MMTNFRLEGADPSTVQPLSLNHKYNAPFMARASHPILAMRRQSKSGTDFCES